MCLESLLHVIEWLLFHEPNIRDIKGKISAALVTQFYCMTAGLYLYNVGQLATHQPPAALRILTLDLTFQIK